MTLLPGRLVLAAPASTPGLPADLDGTATHHHTRDLAAFVATCSDDVALYRAKSGTPLALGKRALAEFHEKSRFGR